MCGLCPLHSPSGNMCVTEYKVGFYIIHILNPPAVCPSWFLMWKEDRLVSLALPFASHGPVVEELHLAGPQFLFCKMWHVESITWRALPSFLAPHPHSPLSCPSWSQKPVPQHIHWPRYFPEFLSLGVSFICKLASSQHNQLYYRSIP